MLGTDTPRAACVPPAETEESLELYLRPYITAMEAMSEQFGYDTMTVCTAVLACHGDVEDAKRFLLHDFAALKKAPIAREQLAHYLASAN